jgi:hypothetical protein
VIPRTDMTEKEIATCITFHFPVTYLQKKMWWKVKKKVLKPLLIIITESIFRFIESVISKLIDSLNRSFYTNLPITSSNQITRHVKPRNNYYNFIHVIG